MNLTQTWLDTFDTVWANYEGLAGGYTWFLVSPLEHHAAVQEQVAQLPSGFKGSLYTLFLPESSPTALLHALEQYQPKGVVVVDRDLAGGNAIQLPEQEFSTSQGGNYRQGGNLPAWVSELSQHGEQGDNALASACALQGISVVVCAPSRVAETCSTWWAKTPHSLRYSEETVTV